MAKIPPFDIDARNNDQISLNEQIRKAFVSLQQILLNLSPKDNFKSFIWEGNIAATTEQRIRNKLGMIPLGRLVVRGNGVIISDGTTAWTDQYVYVKNESAVQATGLVIIFFI